MSGDEAPGETPPPPDRVEATIRGIGRERAVLCGALCSELVAVLAYVAPPDATLDELMRAAAAFSIVGLRVQEEHPQTHARALRTLARAMYEKANKIDPEGAPS